MFTHLHVHSQYSLLESSVKIKELVEACAGLGMKTLALTDKYVMSGAVEFYKQAKAAGIKPITGCEICLSRKIIKKSASSLSGLTDSLPLSGLTESRSLSHLTLLVKNQKGYENLCSLVSSSHIRSLSYLKDTLPADLPPTDILLQANILSTHMPLPDASAVCIPSIEGPSVICIPSIEMEELEKFSEGIICLSGCGSNGELSRLLRAGDKDGAEEFSRRLLEIFADDFYIEIQRYRTSVYNSNSMQGTCSELLLSFAEKMKIPVAATNNVHYLTKNDYKIYRCLSKIKLMGTKIDPLLNILENDEHYLKSYTEMARLFNDIPSAITNTGKIALKCDFGFTLGRIILPHFTTPSGESQTRYLEQLCIKGVKSRYGEKPGNKVLERLAMELSVIAKTGFAGYFLVAADIAGFACENNIPICGKGSAAGSLVSYILRISNVDPVENNLYFERFLNEERKDPPDIDIDIASRGREKISDYLRSKYGSSGIARVACFATTKPRAAIREAGRILNMSKDEIDYLVKAAPDYNRFFTSEKMRQSFKSSNLPDINNPNYLKVLSIADRIGGYVRHASMHPSAFIISNYDLLKKIPLTLSETGEIMSQYDMNSIDDLGILKMDLISSLSLSLIADTIRIIKKTRGIHVDFSTSGYNDKKVYELMQNGLTLGIFQLESFGIRTLSRKVRPECLNDITLLVSLYRPGPQQSGMVGNFIERKFGREKTTYIHEDLAPLLKETYGVILYQEQAMQAAIKIAGYSLSEADTLRKAVFNLSKEEMDARLAGFIKRAASKGYDLATASEAFRLISKFASYGFVKAHAAAYAELSYKTCYLKSRFPAEFISAILTNNSGYYSKMQYVEEARRLGIKIKLPDINESGMDFEACDCGRAIRVPLISIKNLGYAGADSIIREREINGRFADFEDFYNRVVKNCRLNKNAVENLIRIGAFDYCSISGSGIPGIGIPVSGTSGSGISGSGISGSGISGKRLLAAFYNLRSLKKPALSYKNKKNRSPGRQNTEATLDASIFSIPGSGQDIAAKLLKSDCHTEDHGCSDEDHGFAGFNLEEKLETQAEILGFYVSAHPLQCFKQKLELKGAADPLITRSRDFYKQDIYGPSYSGYICTAGIVISKRLEKTRDSKNMMFCTMEDEDGMYEAVFFSEAYRKSAKIIANHPFIIIKGSLHFKDNNVSVIAKDVINIASLKKLEDLRKEENIRAGFLSGTEKPWAL